MRSLACAFFGNGESVMGDSSTEPMNYPENLERVSQDKFARTLITYYDYNL